MSDDVIRSLVDFGLTAMQSRVYAALLQLGTCRASQVGLAVRIVRPEAYRILRELSVKALVERNATTPSTYTATSPALALRALVERFDQHVSALETRKSALLQSLEDLRKNSPVENESSDRFSIIGGSSLVLRQREMITKAEHDYAGIFSKYGLTTSFQSGFVSELLAAKRRGIKVRLIVEVDDSNVKQARYLTNHFEIRQNQNILFYMAIIDGRQMVLGPAITNHKLSNFNIREANLWTNSTRFVNGMYAIFENLWKHGHIFRTNHLVHKDSHLATTHRL